MLHGQFLDPLHRLGRRRLRVALVDRRQVLETVEPLGPKAPPPLGEARPVESSLAARFGDVAQLSCQFQNAQAMLGTRAPRIPLTTLRPPCRAGHDSLLSVSNSTERRLRGHLTCLDAIMNDAGETQRPATPKNYCVHDKH